MKNKFADGGRSEQLKQFLIKNGVKVSKVNLKTLNGDAENVVYLRLYDGKYALNEIGDLLEEHLQTTMIVSGSHAVGGYLIAKFVETT